MDNSTYVTETEEAEAAQLREELKTVLAVVKVANETAIPLYERLGAMTRAVDRRRPAPLNADFFTHYEGTNFAEAHEVTVQISWLADELADIMVACPTDERVVAAREAEETRKRRDVRTAVAQIEERVAGLDAGISALEEQAQSA